MTMRGPQEQDLEEQREAQLRNRSSAGTGVARLGGGKTEEWRCRSCECVVVVDAFAIQMRETMNRELARRKQQPISSDECVFCDDCGAKHRERKREESLRRSELLRQACATLKNGGTAQAISAAEAFVRLNADNGYELVEHFRETRKSGRGATAQRTLEDV